MFNIRKYLSNSKGIGAPLVILILIVVVIIIAWALIWSQAVSVNVSNFGDVWLAIIIIAVVAGAIIAALVLLGKRS